MSYHLLLIYLFPGDDTYTVPEDARPEAPPSYASAQADAVPPYWETTIHAPFSGDSIGDMIIDSLPTGSLFSFLWNMLVSISFQFVGFLLTYLLHTSHAARLGSRAGLGVTLIQYGFALRSRTDAVLVAGDNGESWTGFGTRPSFDTAAEAEEYYKNMANSNTTAVFSEMTEEQAGKMVASATTEWLSFFLMTVGMFAIPSPDDISYIVDLLAERLVHSPHIRAEFLACQTLGTRYLSLPAREQSRRNRPQRPYCFPVRVCFWFAWTRGNIPARSWIW